MTAIDARDVERCVIDALERMFFVTVEPCEPVAEASYGAHVVIDLVGDEDRARVLLSATDGFLAELASSMVGSDPGEIVLEDDGLDALKEVTNVCSGEITRLLGGEDRRIRSGLPTVVREPDVRGDLALVFETLGEQLRLRIEHTPPA